MYVCRLFHADRPAEPIDARLFAAGVMTVGRDPAADWPLDDPEGLLSRIHCTLSADAAGLRLHDSSTNGTFLPGGERVPRGAAVPLAVGQPVRLGQLVLRVDAGVAGAAVDTTIVLPPPAPLPSDWDAPPAPTLPPHPDASLVEAFCEGARLDVSTFSDEDPAVLMRRVGGIYRQAVLGLAAAMAQRGAMKEAQDLARTSVGPGRNNPVKWTAPRRLGEALLRGGDGSYLEGEQAIEQSFADLSAHLAALAAGINGTVAALLDRLDPDGIADAAAEAPGFALRGRGAARAAIHADRHRALRDGGAVRLFRDAYLAGDAA